MALLIAGVWSVLFLRLLGTRLTARESALAAFAAISAAVLLLTEALSAFTMLAQTALGASWAVLLVAALVGARQRLPVGWARLKGLRPDSWSALDTLLAVALGCFAIGTLMSALLYPVTNYDSLTYHMPRVFFWLQNKTVEAFPTSESRQLFSSVFVEYFVLQLKALSSGSDRLVNLVQWLSYIFSLVTVSLIAERFGAGRRAQMVAALVAASTPMALLQASTTQNDLTSALWCLAAAYCTIRYTTGPPLAPRERVWLAALLGISLALAVHSKPTAYLVCLPFSVWLAVAATRREGWGQLLRLAAVSLLCAVLLSAPMYVRNARLLDGDFLALSAPGNAMTVLEGRSVADITTNGLKNASMLLGTPSPAVNYRIARAVRLVTRLYGGSTISAQANTLGWGPYRLRVEPFHHDFGPAPFTMALILFAALVIVPRRRRVSGILPYLLSAVAGICLIAGLVLWQPWINRLLLAGVLLLAPLAAVAVERLTASGPRWLTGVGLVLVTATVLFGATTVLFNSTNPLVSADGQTAGYWNTTYRDLQLMRSSGLAALETATTAIEAEEIGRVGIDIRVENYPVYPLLLLLDGRQVGYVHTTLLSDRIDDGGFAPDAVVEILLKAQYLSAPPDRTADEHDLVEPQQTGPFVVRAYSER